MSSVLVYCDDDAKGRVTKIATFSNESGEWVEVRAVMHTGELRPAVVGDHGTGDKATLRCRLCGVNVQVHMTSLAPILDKIAAGGLDRVQIGNLARIVTRRH